MEMCAIMLTKHVILMVNCHTEGKVHNIDGKVNNNADEVCNVDGKICKY